MLRHLITAIALSFMTIAAPSAWAEPADIDAAARGVVRVVIIGTDGQEVYPVSHGTGFAVSPDKVVTNAHVVREALQDDTLRIGIVPSESLGDGEPGAFATAISVSPKNDLALLRISDGLRLPSLTIAGRLDRDSGEVTSVGYPMNVDRAQGLEIGDIFKAQPPVKSRGFLSGRRPSRQFDTLLHTAPIARGNSGGPLLDGCGRVLGVNSFGADSGGSDAEFFFAVSLRELLPFLRANNIDPKVTELPCRSFAELNAQEQERVAQKRSEAEARLNQLAEERREKRDRAQLEAEMDVQADRENAMAIAFLLAMFALTAGLYAWRVYETGGRKKHLQMAGAAAVVAIIAALAIWFTRPGLDAIDRKVAAAMQDNDGSGPIENAGPPPGAVALTCTLDPQRSRITGEPNDALEFDWSPEGCVNGRTQYGYTGGEWSRVFVPREEAAVNVNRYDPETRSFSTDRYLLGRSAMEQARKARRAYSPPSCGAESASATLGDLQGSVTAQLPPTPNERLVYSCDTKGD